MKEQLIQEVQRQMLSFLNNAQLKRLQSVLEGVLSGVELSHSAGMVESAKVDTVACFINAKRIEGCSEKTLSYYRQTIVSMLSGIEKEPQEIVTEDLRKYLTEYQANRKSSKVTIDNIRRILSTYFSWLEDEDYIVKSPVRRIHKVKTATVFEVKDENELLPEYLMLWFSRPEFDRYARFKSHGSVREIMDWDEMCKVELPVPSIDKQRSIVKAYQAITERIELKRRINDNLAA